MASTFQHRENSGSLFKNDRKTSTKHPDYKGKLNVHGAMFAVAGWIKNTGGKSFMSLSISPIETGEQHVSDDDVQDQSWGV